MTSCFYIHDGHCNIVDDNVNTVLHKRYTSACALFVGYRYKFPIIPEHERSPEQPRAATVGRKQKRNEKKNSLETLSLF